MTPILSPNWRGQRAAYIDPASIRFKAVESPAVGPNDACNGCLFSDRKGVCEDANAIAVKNGQPDCEDLSPNGNMHIYVLDDSDPRQLDLLKES